MKTKEKIFINYHVRVDETVRYMYYANNNTQIGEKEIFRLNDSYFLYTFQRNNNVYSYSLRDISKEEFDARKEDILSNCPSPDCMEWEEDGAKYVILNYFNYVWKRQIDSESCMFQSNNLLKRIQTKVVSEERLKKEQTNASNREARQDYAKKCGKLSFQLRIPFVNVMLIGPDEEKLKKFKLSYERAIENVKKMTLQQQGQLYKQLFRCVSDEYRTILDLLDIQYFDAKPRRLDLKELKAVLEKNLQPYTEASLKKALEIIPNLDYDSRKEMYDKLTANNRRDRKEILAELGVDLLIVDHNRYPFTDIKRTLAATLGEDLET